jgi:hypothetical protein
MFEHFYPKLSMTGYAICVHRKSVEGDSLSTAEYVDMQPADEVVKFGHIEGQPADEVVKFGRVDVQPADEVKFGRTEGYSHISISEC